MAGTPRKIDLESRALDLKNRLQKCWDLDLDWTLYPDFLTKVIIISVG